MFYKKIPHDYGKFYQKIKTGLKTMCFSDLQIFVYMERLIVTYVGEKKLYEIGKHRKGWTM